MKHLVMLNMSYQSDWDRGLLNRNYFVLHELIRSGAFDTVLSIDFLPFSVKKIAKVLVEQQPFRRKQHTVFSRFTTRVDRIEDGVFHMSATSMRHLPHVLEQLQIAEQDTVFWNYSPFAADVMTLFPGATHVFDAVDNWAAHSVYAGRAEQLNRAYEVIAKKATVIFTVSEPLADLLGEKAHCIPNGVDAAVFADVTTPANGRIIGYHGNIQSRVDFDLLEHIATQRPEYQFVLHGWVWDEAAQRATQLATQHPNVHFPGRFDYADLPSLMSDWNVAMIPHQQNAFTQSMNPMKVYEYLAAGKPVVSTPIAGLDDLSDHVTIVRDADAFVTALDVALETNSSAAQAARRHAVAPFSWKARIHQMLYELKRV